MILEREDPGYGTLLSCTGTSLGTETGNKALETHDYVDPGYGRFFKVLSVLEVGVLEPGPSPQHF